MKKKTVAASIAAVTSQKEIPTKSFGSRSPPLAAKIGVAIKLQRIKIDFMSCPYLINTMTLRSYIWASESSS